MVSPLTTIAVLTWHFRMASMLFLLNVNRHTIALLNAVFRVTNCNGERRRSVGAGRRRGNHGSPSRAHVRYAVRYLPGSRAPLYVRKANGKLLLSRETLKLFILFNSCVYVHVPIICVSVKL